MKKTWLVLAFGLAGCASAPEKFIYDNWQYCIQNNTKDEGTLIGLPYSYTCPSVPNDVGIFQEMYYWDTYFTNVGLILSDRIDQAKNNCRNMAYLINRYGFMPNGNRTFYLNRSQPPFLSRMVRDIYTATGEKEWIAEMYPVLVKEHKFWTTKRVTTSGLNRYFGDFATNEERIEFGRDFLKRMKMPMETNLVALANYGDCYIAHAESGWDCTSRFGYRAQDFDWVDLNALLYGLEADLEFFAQELKNGEEGRWEAVAEARKDRMNRVLWDDKLGMFADHDFVHDQKSAFVSIAQFYPLFTKVATKAQAEKTVKLLPKLEQRYGVACSQKEGLLDMQWDYPHGWACLHYVMINALENYGYHEDALRIARKYIGVVDKIFDETGCLWEKYNVVKGEISVTREYDSPKMLGWSAGVYLFCRRFCEM